MSKGGQVRRLGRLVRKELSEILRDRRTIITLVLMPLLLYPLLSIAFQQFVLATQKAKRPPVFRIGFRTEHEAHWVSHYLGWETRDGTTRPTRIDPARQGTGLPPVLQIFVPRRPEAARDPKYLEGNLDRSDIDLGIKVKGPGQARPDSDLAADLELLFLDDSPTGREAAAWFESQCRLANVRYLEARLKSLGVSQRAQPVETTRHVLKDPEPKRGNFLAALVPLILILMTITGAVYPAIDLTAGERERGTLEILVAAPVPRLGLLFAKYVTVVTVAVLTALVNLVMMTATLLLTGLGPFLFGNMGLSPFVVVEVFALLLLFAGFFSAVLLILTSFARSFKEAQAYLIPLMLVSLAPGMLAMRSDLSLSGLLSVAPLINIVLLARDLFQGQAQAGVAAVVVLSTVLYAVAALAAAARIFGAEGVLYSEQGSWSDLVRRPARPQPTATLSGALFCVALLFPAAFLVQGLLAHAGLTDPALLVGLQGVGILVLFGLIPTAAAALGRVTPASGFQLHRAPAPAYLGAALLGVCLWPFALEILLALRQWGLTAIGPEHLQKLKEMQQSFRSVSPVFLLIAQALVPAVCEELFFRGYLFSALRAHTDRTTTIVGSALAFGLFHVFFAVDRAVPSFALGLVLGWVCWRTRSVIPGMVIHACHNAVLVVLLPAYAPELERLGWLGMKEDGHLSPVLLAAAAAGAALGIVWIAVSGRSPVAETKTAISEEESLPA